MCVARIHESAQKMQQGHCPSTRPASRMTYPSPSQMQLRRESQIEVLCDRSTRVSQDELDFFFFFSFFAYRDQFGLGEI